MRTIAESSARAPASRQERLEAEIVAVLGAGGTRSELRALVDRLSDSFRMHGLPLDRALESIRMLGSRTLPARAGVEQAVGDSASDRIALMERWCAARFSRSD